MFVPNLKLASTASDTVINIEVDAPEPDFLMGWTYQLEFEPGSTGTATAVKDASGASTFYVSRLATGVTVIDSGARLRIPLKKLGDLRCSTDGSDYTMPCSGGGKFKLKSLTAYSWFDSSGGPVAESSYETAVSASSFTVKSVRFGSPLAATAAAWDKVFYVGASDCGCGCCCVAFKFLLVVEKMQSRACRRVSRVYTHAAFPPTSLWACAAASAAQLTFLQHATNIRRLSCCCSQRHSGSRRGARQQ